MTDIGKITAEIERLKVEIPYHENAWSVLNKVLDFINTLPAEQPSEDLEENIEEKINEYWNEWFSHGEYFEGTLPKNVFAAYCHKISNWQKEQMMKSAIDAVVDEDTENSYIKTLVFIGKQRDALNTRISNYEYGEMVKIIIIKEDEQ